jgi:hypothetical protein
MRISGSAGIRKWYAFAWLTFYLGVSTFVSSLWLFGDNPFHNCGETSATLVSLDRGTMRRPFALRALYPTIVKASHGLLSLETRVDLARRIKQRSPTLASLSRRTCTPERLLIDMLIFLVISWGCFLGFLFALRRVFMELFDSRDWQFDLAPPACLFSMTYLFRDGAHFFYDPFVLVLLPLCVLFLCRRQWLAFYPALALAFFNKETAFVVSIAFAAYTYSLLPRRQWWMHLAAQGVLLCALRAVTWVLFDPGTPYNETNDYVRDYLEKNLFLLWKADFWLDYTAMFSLLAIGALVFLRFAEQPRALRSASLMSLPLLAGYLKSGVWGEVRVFFEVYPFLFLMAYKNVCEILGYPLQVRAGQDGGALLPRRVTEIGWVFALFVAGVGLTVTAVLAYQQRVGLK